MDRAPAEMTTAVRQENAGDTTPAENIAQPAHNKPNSTESASEQPLANPRLVSLQNKRAALTSTLADLQAERARLIGQPNLPSGLAMPNNWSGDERSKHTLSGANAVIKDHSRLLHEYNEIKDIGQGLIGLVAEGRGVRLKAVMEDFGMGEKD